MQKLAIAHIWLFVLALAFASVAREIQAQEAEGAALRDRVMREVPGALARLEALYSQVSISGTMTEESRLMSPADGPSARIDGARRPATEQPLGDLESTWSRKVTLQVSAGLRKTYQRVIFDKHYDKDSHSLRDSATTPLNPPSSAGCLGRDYSFRLRWENDKPILMSFGTSKDEDINRAVMDWHNEFVRAPCGVFGNHPMSELMSFPSFSIRKVTRTPGHSGDNVLIEFEFDVADDKSRVVPKQAIKSLEALGKTPPVHAMWKAWIELSPNEGWAVHGYGPGERPGGPKLPRHEIIYGERRDGFPLPRRIISSGRGMRTIRTFEIESVEFGPVPGGEFTLSAYGLPELDASPRAKGENRITVVIFGGAFVALLSALALKHYANRLRKE